MIPPGGPVESSSAQKEEAWLPEIIETRDVIADIRFAGVTPHVAQNAGPRRRSAIDGRTDRRPGYAKSIHARKRVEQVSGWIKQAAGLRQLKARGRSRAGAMLRLHVVAYKLIRLANLLSPRESLAEITGERRSGPMQSSVIDMEPDETTPVGQSRGPMALAAAGGSVSSPGPRPWATISATS